MKHKELYKRGYDIGSISGRKKGYTGERLELYAEGFAEGWLETYTKCNMSVSEQVKAMTEYLKKENEEFRSLPPEERKKKAHEGLVKMGVINEDGSLTDSSVRMYAEQRDNNGRTSENTYCMGNPLVFPDDVSKNQINRPWQIFDVIYDWDARIRGIIIEKVLDNTFRVLWTNGVIGEVVEASEGIYLVKNILNEINEEYDVNDAVAPCIEPDKFLSEKAIRIQIHISNPIVKTCVVRVVKDEEWFVATDEETAVTSQGKTIEYALANIKEALELYYSEEEEHFVSEIKKAEESVAKGNYITLDELHRNLDYDCNDKECNIISDEKKRLQLEELKKRLENIKDSYFDFVDAIIHYAKRKQEHIDLLNKFLDEHPETSTSDVVYFVSIQPDFFEDSVPQKNGFIKKTENADETEAAEILAEIDNLSPEDLEIVKTETITITKKRKVVKWTHWEDSRYPEVKWIGNWDDMRAYEMAIIEAIREHGYRMKGESHQRHPYGVPVFDDGTRYETTFRRWGSLMAEALGIEGEHAYVTWAFCVPPNETEVFPDPKDWE